MRKERGREDDGACPPTRHSGRADRRDPESRNIRVHVWIPGSPLRGAPE